MTNANIRQKQSINKIHLYALHHFYLKSENKLKKMAAKHLNLNNETFKTLKHFLCLKKNKLKYPEVTCFK